MVSVSNVIDRVYHAGEVVLTIYGVGVIVGRKDEAYSIRLWRIPGKSLGSSARATLNAAAILERVPAAPGMTTVWTMNENVEQGKGERIVLVHCYSAWKRVFVVSDQKHIKAEESDEEIRLTRKPSSRKWTRSDAEIHSSAYWEVTPESLKHAQSAKFYPVLEALMLRGEQTAAVTTKLLESETARNLVQKTGYAIQERSNVLAEKKQEAGGKLGDIAASIQDAIPAADENMKFVLKFVKDQRITDLLQHCKERLLELNEKDLPAKTKETLEKVGIRIQTDVRISTFSESIKASRETALAALESLLKDAELNSDHLDVVGKELAKNFSTAFDSLANAAKSDQALNELFEGVSEQTKLWQDATGRLLKTKSASLFLHGATHLQARAAAIFQKNQLQWAGDIGSQLTKSFTEGDAAIARLKTIELGDAVKNRLVEAIEVRSEALGGLDGIIAGALSNVKGRSPASGDQLKNLLTSLQQNASAVTVNAHETLISVLASRSKYRDAALMRIEAVLCDLESKIGEHVSPDEIAEIVRGEGGTAKIFQPIAKRAMQEIEKQLDAAESQVSDGTVIAVLKRIRKIVSGELTLTALMDDITEFLNDEKVVAAGETFVQHSEHVLDVLESASGSKGVADAIQIAEKAGITKDSVMRELGKLNMDEILDTAGTVISDEKARRKVISSAIDVALDFVLRILPSLPVPPFDGVRDGLIYHISDLSLEGFRVRKEDIQIELAGIRATRKRKKSGQGTSNNPIKPTMSYDSIESGALEIEERQNSVSATELLIIDIKNISAIFEKATWSFEQTYMPYLKGGGNANVYMSGGAIRLQFELRKRRKATSGKSDRSGDEWEPVLCLHDRSCSIANVELNIEGEGRLTWVLNKLAAIFRGPLRDYVVKTIVKILSTQSGSILEKLNTILAPYWSVILRTSKLQMEQLVETNDDVIAQALPVEKSPTVELVWRERLPLGMNLLMNDESGLLKVVDFPRGSQARAVCEKRNLDPEIFKGAEIVSVNGSEYEDQEDLFDALKDPTRPKTVAFRLADSKDAERVRLFVEGQKEELNGSDQSFERVFFSRTVDFTSEGELGIEFGNSADDIGIIVSGFIEGNDGTVLAAEKTGRIKVGDLVTHINGEFVLGTNGSGRARAVALFEEVASKRPLSITFTDPYLHHVIIEKPEVLTGRDAENGPSELILDEKATSDGKKIVINGFKDVCGAAESSGIFIGDHLVFVNGCPVGSACRWLGVFPAPTLPDVLSWIRDPLSYPLALTFARPRQGANRWSGQAAVDERAETKCVTSLKEADLGFTLGRGVGNDMVVADFTAVAGTFQQSLSHLRSEDGKMYLSIDSVCGQFVPSFASKDMVKNAMARSWKADDKVELLLCDDERKAWVLSLLGRDEGNPAN